MDNGTVGLNMATPKIDLNLWVDYLSSTSLGLSWSSPLSWSKEATYFNINCNSSSSTFITQNLNLSRSHCISYMYLVDNSTSKISVTGLMPGTNYTCCVATDMANFGNSTGCVDIVTVEESMGTRMLNAVAGAVGGTAAMIVVLLLILAVAGIVVLSVHYVRKRRLSA